MGFQVPMDNFSKVILWNGIKTPRAGTCPWHGYDADSGSGELSLSNITQPHSGSSAP